MAWPWTKMPVLIVIIYLLFPLQLFGVVETCRSTDGMTHWCDYQAYHSQRWGVIWVQSGLETGVPCVGKSNCKEWVLSVNFTKIKVWRLTKIDRWKCTTIYEMFENVPPIFDGVIFVPISFRENFKKPFWLGEFCTRLFGLNVPGTGLRLKL